MRKKGCISLKGQRLSYLTCSEAKKAFKTYSIAMLPVGGGAKEHGDHLPYGTDLMIVDELANRIIEQCPVLLLPTVPYGYFPAFVDWPGSVSISATHFMNYISDIIKSIHKFGITKFLVLDGGITTHDPLKIIASDLHNELGVSIAITNIDTIGRERTEEVCQQKQGGHACEAETSQLLAINKNLVKMDRAVKNYRSPFPNTVGEKGLKKITLRGKFLDPSGINGDATLATVEKGEEILKAKADDVIAFINHF